MATPLMILLSVATTPVLLSAQVLINEFQSSNTSTFADEDGDYEDWIELYNTSEADSVDLGHFGLSDDYDRPFRWTFPEKTVIAPGDFLLIRASGKDRNDPDGELHTSFSIAQSGEELLLTHFQTGERLDEIAPIEVPSDKSYGRLPDGSDNWVFFSNPTPGTSNSDGASVMPEPVSFLKKGGFYHEAIYLELSSDDNMEIRFTLDGSEPDANSLLYDGKPIRIEDRTRQLNDLSTFLEISNDYGRAAPPADYVFKGTVVRAAAFGRGERSTTTTQTYFVNEQAENRYTLPVISLSTHRDSLFGYDRGIYALGRLWDEDGQAHGLGAAANFSGRGHDWERPMHMEMYESDGEQVISQDIGVRIHGGASRHFPQKSFRLYSRSDYGTSRFRYRFFPEMELDNFNRLILRQSGQDVTMTMFRDAYIQETVKHMRFPTQSTRAIILFINGEYWGIYNIRERFDIHFLETHYDIDRDDVDLMTGSGTLKDGERDHYDALIGYISNPDNDPRIENTYRHIQTMMDTDNFMDYYIAQIYARNTDWPHNNIDYWRYRTEYNPDAPVPQQDGRWRWMMFDMDFGFGWQSENWPSYRPNDWNKPRWLDRQSYIRNMMDYVSRDDPSTLMFRRLMRNHEFRTNFLNRFADMMNTTFRPERMTSILDSMKTIYAPEIDEHIIRWNKTEPEVWDHFYRPFITFDEWVDEVNIMREYVEKRHEHQWEHLMDYTGRSTAEITLDVSDSEHGHVTINSIAIDPSTEGISTDPWPWTGTYFRFFYVNLKAEPDPEYRFHQWLRMVDGDTLDYSPDKNLRLGLTEDIHLVAEFRHISVGTDDDDNESDVPVQFNMHQNYPNPFNDKTILPYELPESGHVTVTVYTVDGREAETVDEGIKSAGQHTMHFHADGLTSGVYIIRMRVQPENGEVRHQGIRRITLLK